MRLTAVSLLLCAAAFCAAQASAAVVTGTATNPDGGGFVLGVPPGATVGGNTINLADVFAFDERVGVTLTAPLSVLGPDGMTIALPIGTVVDSHYIEWDPARGQRGQASVTFSGPILGYIVSRRALVATDARFGRAGVTYVDGNARGVEVPGDVVTVAGDVLSFDAFGRLPEGIRVFTLSDIGTGSEVPLPGAAAFMLTGLVGAGAARRRSTHG